MLSEGVITELRLLDEVPAVRIACPAKAVPAAGQYLLLHADHSEAPLGTAVFAAETYPDGFLAAPPVPEAWMPGTRVFMRGPLGHGFSLPDSARRVALIAFDDRPFRLRTLLDLSIKQQAEVTLVCASPPEGLPLQVEVQPLRALAEVCSWADYVAIDAGREKIPELKAALIGAKAGGRRAEGQVLVRVPMPCGGLAECGVCSVELQGGVGLACEDGPVFGLAQL